jgi:hypothetical protein
METSHDTPRFAMYAEIVHNPHANYTIVGRIIKAAPDNWESNKASAREATYRVVNMMPGPSADLADGLFRVFPLRSPDEDQFIHL